MRMVETACLAELGLLLLALLQLGHELRLWGLQVLLLMVRLANFSQIVLWQNRLHKLLLRMLKHHSRERLEERSPDAVHAVAVSSTFLLGL